MRKARIFISYSRRGHGPRWKAALLHALQVFERQHVLDVWHDGKIREGAAWQDEIEQALADAGAAIVLLTPEALDSQFIVDVEFPILSRRQRRDGLPVFPVICEACEWNAHYWLRATQAPNASLPLAVLDEAAQGRLFRKLAADIAEELSRAALAERPRPDRPLVPDRIYLDRLPLAGGPGLREEKLIGREQELALLDLAFAQPDTAIVSLVAWGGVGKTMLVQHWLRRLERQGWLDADRVYAWSFYSQGTREDRQASEDSFLAHALQWFGVKCAPTLSAWDKGRLLADAVAREHNLLILDGIEPLQYPPGPIGGRLRAPGVQSLLNRLAGKTGDAGHRGLCLVTTREPLTDLSDFERRPDAAWGSVLRADLHDLTEEAGALLLHHAGAKRAGAAGIEADDAELLAASRDVKGHALTLNLLGRFLARALGGDVRRRDLVKFEEADRIVQGGTTFKMLAAFEDWLAGEGEIEARSLAVLRLLGLFDRPADEGCIGALRDPPVLVGLTEALFTVKRDASTGQTTESPLSDKAWRSATSFLADFGLITVQAGPDDRECLLDCHPLIREHFARRLLGEAADNWSIANRRLYEHLVANAEARPSTIEGLLPLYQAVTHGCRAGLQDRACDRVYFARIKRGNAHFSSNKLGAFGSNLSAIACFFDKPWKTASPALTGDLQAWVLSEAAISLKALGRLSEAADPMRAGLDMRVRQGLWRNAAIAAANLSQLVLMVGRVGEAVKLAEQATVHADRSGNEFQSLVNRSTLANALHQADLPGDAERLFREAEIIQSLWQPEFPLLYSVSGFWFCDLLLAKAERAAWRRIISPCRRPAPEDRDLPDVFDAVDRRTRKLFEWRAPEDPLLDIGIDNLTAGRARFYAWILTSDGSHAQPMINHLHAGVDGLRHANAMDRLPDGLLSRAWLLCLAGDADGARSDLDEAWQIAERGPMRLHMVDIRLHRARLFFREKPYPWGSPRDDLAAAEALIDECGYHRRDEELADAKMAILGS